MHTSLELLINFVGELWGVELLHEPPDSRILKIKELKNAREALINFNPDPGKSLSKEFVKYVFPLLEVLVEWRELKRMGRGSESFLEKCKLRVNTQSSFYGTTFEIDIASRGFFSGFEIDFLEDYSKEEKQIDFLFNTGEEVVGVECFSKRYSESRINIKTLNADIHEKARKFKREFSEKLARPLDKKILVIDLTVSDYSLPKITEELKGIRISSGLDGVIFTWREDVIDGINHSLRVKYKVIGNLSRIYFLTSYAAEFRLTDKGLVLFWRKYVEPEPAFKSAGPPESLEDYLRG